MSTKRQRFGRLEGIQRRLEDALRRYLHSTRRGERLVTFAVFLRLLLLYIVVVRFGLNLSDLAEPGLLRAVRFSVWLMFVYVLALGYFRLYRPDTFISYRSKWCQVLADTVIFSALYLLSQDPKSDLSLLYLVPLLIVSDYLSPISNVAAFVLVSSTFIATSYAIVGAPAAFWQRWFLTSAMTRLSLFGLFEVGVWWLHRLHPALAVDRDRARLLRSFSELGTEPYLVGDDYRLLWVSPKLQSRHGENFWAKPCFSYFMGRSTPCPGCPLALGSGAFLYPKSRISSTARDISGVEYQAESEVSYTFNLGGIRAVAGLRDVAALKQCERELEAYAARVAELADAQVSQLARDGQRLSDQLSSVIEAAVLSAADRQDREILEQILSKCARQMDSSFATVRTLGPCEGAERSLMLHATYGLADEHESQVSVIPLEANTVLVKAFKLGKSQVCVGAKVRSQASIDLGASAEQDGLHSMVSLPMFVRGETIGTCTFYRQKAQGYTSEEKALGQAVASLLAVSLDNLRLYREEDRWTRERQEWLLVLQELNTALTGEAPESVMHNALQLILQRLRAETAAIFLWEDGKLRRKAIAGLPDDFFPDESYGFGEGLTGRVIAPGPGRRYGQPIRHNSVDQGQELLWPHILRYRRALPSGVIKHVIAVPLNIQERSFGVLRVMNHLEDTGLSPRGFTESQVDLLGMVAAQLAMAIERGRLFEADRGRRTLAERLTSSSLALSSHLQLDLVLEQILDHLQSVVHYDSATVQVLRDDGFHVVACRGFEHPEQVKDLVFPLQPGFPNTLVFRRTQAYIVDDVRLDYPHFADPRWQGTHIRSWLGVPMCYQAQVVGMIALDSRTPEFYSESHAAMALAFATQAAVALENARLYEQLGRQAQGHRHMLEVLRELGGMTDKGQLAEAVVGSALALVSAADGAVLHFLDPFTSELRPVVCQPTDGVATGDSPMALGKGIAGLSLQSRETINVPDVDGHPHFAQTSQQDRLKSLLVSPLYAGESKLIGTLSLYSAQIGAFQSRDADFLSMLASMAGASLANIELWQAREEQRGQVKMLLEAISQFDMDVGLKELCQRISRTACDVLGWKAATIKLLNVARKGFVVGGAHPASGPGSFAVHGTLYPVARIHDMLAGAASLGHCSWVRGAYTRMRHAVAREELPSHERNGDPAYWWPGDALMVPLEAADLGNIGWLAVADPERGAPPSMEEIQLIELLAKQAGVAVARALLHQQTAVQRDRLRAFISLLRPRIGAFDQVDALAVSIVEALVGLLGTDTCSLWLTGEGQRLECVAATGESGRTPPLGRASADDVACTGPLAYVTSTREVLCLTADELREHPACGAGFSAIGDLPADDQCSLWVFVPLISSRNVVVGALHAEVPTGLGWTAGFSKADSGFLEALGRQIAADIERVQERKKIAQEERSRLESELHEAMDVLVGGVRWELERTRESFLQNRGDDVMYGLQRMQVSAKRAYEDLRYILRDLGNPILTELGLVPALQDYVDVIGAKKVFVHSDSVGRLPTRVEHILYRIAQEAISNALKHSGIDRVPSGAVRVEIVRDQQTVGLRVSDNGRGFDVVGFDAGVQLSGLRRMEEWAAAGDVELRIVSSPGKGTTVSAYAYA